MSQKKYIYVDHLFTFNKVIWSNWDQTFIYLQAMDAEQAGEDKDKGGVQFSVFQDGMIKVITNVIIKDWFKEVINKYGCTFISFKP